MDQDKAAIINGVVQKFRQLRGGCLKGSLGGRETVDQD